MGQVYSHLSEEERQVVRIEMGNGASVRRMAMMPGRHASTAGREIRRDTWFPSNESESYRPCRPRRLRTGPWTGRCHVAGPARRRAMRREAVARRPRRLASGRLRAWVAERSRRGRSPPLMCGRLAMGHPGGPVTRCRPEAVCRWTYAGKARRERRARCLPRGRRRRRKAGGGRAGRGRVPLRTSICERPCGRDDGSRFGEREADGVIGAGRSLHTEVGRRTRFLMAAIVPDETAAASCFCSIGS
ncbi:IS30 family transposase [Bifidobacterium breve]|nr:IS30 family transposase [Bifidobacterium breve]